MYLVFDGFGELLGEVDVGDGDVVQVQVVLLATEGEGFPDFQRHLVKMGSGFRLRRRRRRRLRLRFRFRLSLG